MFIATQSMDVLGLQHFARSVTEEVFLFTQYFKPTKDCIILMSESSCRRKHFTEDMSEIYGLIQPTADFFQSMLANIPI